jgi:transcription antitermination factor NusG
MLATATAEKILRPIFPQNEQREPEPISSVPALRLHNFSPWNIVRSQPNQEAKAKESLLRAGFESYFGERQEVVRVSIPASKISSKTRYRRRSETRDVVRTYPVYPGYLFVRRLYGGSDLWQSFELPGIIGLCCFGERPATVEDYTVELLRLSEARGKFDHHTASTDQRHIKIALRERANPPLLVDKSPRNIQALDGHGKSLQFIEELGRITRIIQSPDDVIAIRAAHRVPR